MIVRKKRLPVYPKPCLKVRPGERTTIGSKSADDEFERRNVERRFYRRLSRYYLLPEGMKIAKVEWTRPPLLVTGKHGDDHLTTLCSPKFLVLKDLLVLEDRGDLEDVEIPNDLKGLENLEKKLADLEDPEDLEDIPAPPTLPGPSSGS